MYFFGRMTSLYSVLKHNLKLTIDIKIYVALILLCVNKQIVYPCKEN